MADLGRSSGLGQPSVELLRGHAGGLGLPPQRIDGRLVPRGQGHVQEDLEVCLGHAPRARRAARRRHGRRHGRRRHRHRGQHGGRGHAGGRGGQHGRRAAHRRRRHDTLRREHRCRRRRRRRPEVALRGRGEHRGLIVRCRVHHPGRRRARAAEGRGRELGGDRQLRHHVGLGHHRGGAHARWPCGHGCRGRHQTQLDRRQWGPLHLAHRPAGGIRGAWGPHRRPMLHCLIGQNLRGRMLRGR
mmetsp:Transcript_87069/g.281073  ORF Transcript_87069/g.281073 Transcript_87069/m.281073 type:complete len:243 (+) Transcript_87069:162-890(+)